MLSTSTDPAMEEMRALLAIPRPRTRSECREGPRPCPWVGCPMHLLIEVAKPERHHRGWAARAPGMLLSQARGPGRRRRLSSSAAAALVEVWIDNALELLWSMPDSCALDVAERGEARVGELAAALARSKEGTRQMVRTIERDALARLRSVDGG